MGIAGEFDLGKNAFSSGNLFSGSGPPTEFGTTPAPPQYVGWTHMVDGILNSGESRQEGWDVFGHYHIPNTPFTTFGMFQYFYPNTKISKDPLDFQRFIVGVSYQFNEYLRFALNSQNLIFYHKQFTFPAEQGIATTTDAVPRDSHSFWLNMEFNY